MLEFSEIYSVSGELSRRQITANSSTSNEVMYEVPAGKTFTGFIMGYQASALAKINDKNLYVTAGGTGFSAIPIPLTLLAGTVVKCGSTTQITLVGVEE